MVDIRPTSLALCIVKLHKNLQRKQQKFQLLNQQVVLKCVRPYLSVVSMKLKEKYDQFQIYDICSIFSLKL